MNKTSKKKQRKESTSNDDLEMLSSVIVLSVGAIGMLVVLFLSLIGKR